MQRTRDVLDLVAELERDPSLRGVLEDALLQHERAGEHWLGFESGDVHASPHLMRRLLQARVVDQAYRSRSSTCYRLADVATVREALRLARPAGSTAAAEPVDRRIPDDLFDVVEGHDRVKRVLSWSLEADRPVHVLLVGPPASAKSLFLAELERLPGARRALGSTTTKAGIVGYLLSEPGCRMLLIDEIDKADGRELTALYGLMAEGRVERLQHGRSEQEQRLVTVYATANEAAVLRDALLSRFVALRLEPYSEDEFRRVAWAVLVRREGADPELATEVAHAVAPWSRDPRAAVSIYRLCHGDRRRVAELVQEVLVGG